ncbi:ATP-dependent RNA helicase DHX29, partial [Tremellales sp. Uapishka_1]
MGKKKLALKPIQRGFATTSVAAKAPATSTSTEEQEEGASAALDEAQSSSIASNGYGQPTNSENVPRKDNHLAFQAEDWDDEKSIEEAHLQGIVDRLHDKGEKEVARVIKAIEFDKRLALSFPKLDVNTAIRDQALALALVDEQAGLSETASAQTVTASSTVVDEDRSLLRLYVAYHVLQKLGFSLARVEQCLLQGLGNGQGWEEGLEWVSAVQQIIGKVSKLNNPRCGFTLQRTSVWHKGSLPEQRVGGDTALSVIDVSQEPVLPEVEELQLGDLALDSPATIDPTIDDEPTTTISASDTAPVVGIADMQNATATSLFQPLEISASDSDSDAEPNLNRLNESWASKMLELDTMRHAGSAAKIKGKKGKSNGVVLETPEMRKLKDSMLKIEKEYLFSRKDADQLFKSLKAKRDAQALERKLKGIDPPVNIPDETLKSGNIPPAVDSTDDFEDISMFGNMLDEPTFTPIESGQATLNTTMAIRSMPIPKQFSFGGNIPKALLRSSLSKSARQAVITYANLSGASRAARAGLEVRWSPTQKRVWRMDDIACEDKAEAENYVTTLALHALVTGGEINGVNWRTMPPTYRDLWEELEMEAKNKADGKKREAWKTLKTILNTKSVAEAGLNTAPTLPVVPSSESTPPTKIDVEAAFSERLRVDFEHRRSSKAYQTMLQTRDTLPIARYRNEIINALESSQILVLSGETGCGKSTQLPSFILEDQLSRGQPCKIFVTEPRRISAISLAQRVSQELGDAPGSMGTNSSLVGYSIRLEAKVSPATRLAFVTNGIALRMLESGSGNGRSTGFDEVTHIIIDEVHERSIESDFLLIVLKSLILQRRDLKVVLMSATVDAEKISNFFGGCPFMTVPGRTFPVNVNYLEDAIEVAGWQMDESSPYAIRHRNRKQGAKQMEWTEEVVDDEDSDNDEKQLDPTKLSATRYSATTVSTVNLLDSRQIPYDLIERLLEKICFGDVNLLPFSQAILIFMPGLAEIRKVNDALQSHPAFGTADFVIYPLHSTISSEGQSAVFDVPPPGSCLATNIAETGVTIPDITCVIDSGKHRELRYDEKRQISRLVETFIARSNAKQRRGRAGRVQEGLAFHLFTKARHDAQLAEHPVPEMLRLSLQDLALRIKILKVKIGNSIEDVLSKALDAPSALNIQRAIASLVEVKALTSSEEITPMGRLLSRLPMDVHLGKFLLVAALFKCLDPALTIAATLNSKSPFVTPFGFETQADNAKKAFAIGNSDFLTIHNVFASWRRASDNPNFVRTFCKRNFVSHQNLQQIEELRQQLLSYLVDTGFVEVDGGLRQEINQARFSKGFRTRFVSVPASSNVNAESPQIISAALAAGLYPKLLALDVSSGVLKTITNQQAAAIHPSSINFRVPKSEFGSNYVVYFTIMQSKKLYAWETGPVEDRALALLCGDSADFRFSASSFQIDRKIRYHVQPKTAMAFKLLRERFALAMSMKMRGKPLSGSSDRWFRLGLDCLTTGLYDAEGPSVGMS